MDELTAPVEHAVDLAHENRITKLEEGQTAQDTALIQQLNDLRTELMQAIEARDPGEKISALADRLLAVEGRVEDVAAQPVNAVEDEGPGATFEAPAIEESPAPPEKERRGIHARRKKRREK